jgi:hypothetical protein
LGVFALLFSFWSSQAWAVPYGVNLIVNPGAELGPSSSTGAAVIVPGWVTSGPFTVIPYGSPGFPGGNDPGPSDRGKNFFAGGNAQTTGAFQQVDVSANAADINQGNVSYTLSGALGGSTNQPGFAILSINFSNGQTDLGTFHFDPVNRNGVTELLYVQGTALVPVNTTTITVVLAMNAANGTFNNAYADNIGLTLRRPRTVTTIEDSGAGSLREALVDGNVITFDPSVFALGTAPHIISLNSALPDLADGVVINGPGARVLTVQRSTISGTPPFRIFYIPNPFSPGVSTGAKVTMSGLTIANGNMGTLGVGGGIFMSQADAIINDCVVIGNTAFVGGGISVDRGQLVVQRSAIRDNFVMDNSSSHFTTYGGGVYVNQGSVSFVNSVMTGNFAVGGIGGAVYNDDGGVTFTTSTLSGNSATSFGGVASRVAAGHLVGVAFDSSTVSNNGPAAIRQDGGTLELRSSIFDGPSPVFSFADAAHAGVFSSGYNLCSDGGDGVLVGTGDQINLDPKLGPLQDNGGPTLTHALLAGSPAIDKGNSGFATDQRGFLRPIDIPNSANGGGNKSDVGAFELQVTTLANISTRLRVETGDNALIGGFIVTGTQPKKVIIRGIGPSLGLADQLANPTLELYSGQTLLKANDDWQNSSAADTQAIVDSTIPPTNNLESAIVATLPAGGAGYTAVLRGVNNGTGIGVIQIYDLDRVVDSKLANISTRGFVQTGDNVLFAGTIVLGDAPQKVIIRALGPSTGVPGAMADSTLQLVDAQGGQLAFDDNWRTGGQEAEIIATGVPPTNDAESAIVYNLPANGANYTAIVRGAGGSTGIAVVEVYALN